MVFHVFTFHVHHRIHQREDISRNNYGFGIWMDSATVLCCRLFQTDMPFIGGTLKNVSRFLMFAANPSSSVSNLVLQ